jgi:Dyp-type peroxidase family
MWWTRKAKPDLGDLQGNLLTPYRRRPCTAFTFVRVDDPEGGRRFLHDLLPSVTTEAASQAQESTTTTCNVAVTAAGLAALGVSGPVLRSLPPAFGEGMAARAGLLGDVGPSAPDAWEPPYSEGEPHVLITQYGPSIDVLDAVVVHLSNQVERTPGVAVASIQRAERPLGSIEPFGFRDGIAQPALAAVGAERPKPGDGTPAWFGRWKRVPLGEFVFGYPDADGVRPTTAPDGRLGHNGTYVVYRKLRQDVDGFKALLAAGRERFPAAELLGAKLVGRWPNGAPLARWPAASPKGKQETARLNDFRYGNDMVGRQCPVGAHVRRTNPRDATGAGPGMAQRHRIIRRGVPYQEPGGERGLVFVCYNADLERQFERIQRMWLNDGDALGLGRDPDPIAGNWDPAAGGPRRFVIPGDQPVAIDLQGPLVTTRGGTYLLLPSMDALRGLSAGEL